MQRKASIQVLISIKIWSSSAPNWLDCKEYLELLAKVWESKPTLAVQLSGSTISLCWPRSLWYHSWPPTISLNYSTSWNKNCIIIKYISVVQVSCLKNILHNIECLLSHQKTNFHIVGSYNIDTERTNSICEGVTSYNFEI